MSNVCRMYLMAVAIWQNKFKEDYFTKNTADIRECMEKEEPIIFGEYGQTTNESKLLKGLSLKIVFQSIEP